MNKQPKCYSCVHCRDIPGDAHKSCNNIDANVKASMHGIAKGWFFWPMNFDPTWLESCDGFSSDPKDDKPIVHHDPLKLLLSILR